MRKFLVLLAAAAFVVAVSAPSFAAEWSFYGSARVGTFWTSTDYKDTYNSATDPQGNGLTDDTDTDYWQYLQGNSRVGANVKVTDNLTGRFEYGHSSKNRKGTDDNVSLRLLYGEYDFGGWKLEVGQDYTPLNHFISDQVFDGDVDLLPYGGFYQGRQPMVQFKFGGLSVAFIEPFQDEAPGFVEDIDVIMPCIAADYVFKAERFLLKVAGGYQTLDVVDNDDNDEDITSYVFYAGVEIPLGALYLNAGAFYSQNGEDMGMWNGVNTNASVTADAAGLNYNVDDVTAWGAIGVVGWRMSDMMKFEGGLGYIESDPDATGLDKEKLYSWYVNAQIHLAKGVFVQPEVGSIIQKDLATGGDGPETYYFGAKWQINF